MKQRIKIKRILLSADFFAALICAVGFAILMKTPASADIVKELTSLAITTLSILFSVFFAAMAVLITSGDNEFVKFLQTHNWFTEIVWSFKWTFYAIFTALVFSIVLYVTTLFELAKQIPGIYPYFILAPYVFFTLYSLFGTVLSTLDAIKYSEYRTKYIMIADNLNKSTENAKIGVDSKE